MQDSQRFQLVGGPYRMPRCRIGGRLKCKLRGKVRVARITDAPIPWPQAYSTGNCGKLFLVVAGDLVRAVKRESAQALAHHFGVGITTVWTWRKALGIRQTNPGTRRLRQLWAEEIFDEETQQRSREATRLPETRAKVAASKRGK